VSKMFNFNSKLKRCTKRCTKYLFWSFRSLFFYLFGHCLLIVLLELHSNKTVLITSLVKWLIQEENYPYKRRTKFQVLSMIRTIKKLLMILILTIQFYNIILLYQLESEMNAFKLFTCFFYIILIHYILFTKMQAL
jgi:hypothetical protein